MSRVFGFAAAAIAVFVMAGVDRARADILVQVDKASQRMSVIVDGEHRYSWSVSTGVGGTPSGTYRPQSLDRNHRSGIYGNAPMPYSIFYSGNYAIHGTPHVRQLGSRASRGCIRLHPSNAAVLFSLVQQRGLGSTRIQIH
jgi:lipoprotein-anchoring transpeptidase ErfK/SrfK